ncbi:MAG TPA: protein kinase, partial [Terriglobales bacterium]|nr:protein kinase [Terriglobales bacterium]
MALATGSKLGPYEILGPAGAGGMGEVYRARDTRLERTVAIKVLPEQFSQNPDLKQRFEREARAISSLNHPNICTLYDVGHQEGVDYLVLEYIEGESLAERLQKGALPVEQTLKTGCEIAEALEKAHRQGIVHRDLKPGNVMLTKSGAKLLDFGLAKPQTPLAVSASSSAVVTQTKPVSPITAQGHIVGTFQYMSPEQVEGKEADARSDIFALGAVLYEMATGKRAFEGKSTISVASAILEREPEPISKLQPLTPPALEQVVKGCLAKDPEERFQTAHDVKLQLKWIAEGGSSAVGVAAPLAARRKRREWVAWALVALLALAAGWAGWRMLRSGAGSRVTRLTVALPRGTSLLGPETIPMAVSPDGSAVVYSAAGEDKKLKLFLRRLESFEATPIPGTEGGQAPFFSPDGQWLGFFSDDDRLKKVSLAGGSAVVLSDAVFPGGGAWAPDGTIYFEKSFFGGLYAVPAGGGAARQVTTPGTKKDDRAHLWPDVLPGGKALIFTVWTGGSFDDARIEGLWLKTGERKLLVQGGTCARYVPATGQLIYAHGGTLFAVPFDSDKMEVKGPPVPVVEGVQTGAANGDAHYSFSAKGVLAFEPGSFTPVQRNLMWMDRTGKMEKDTDEVRP